MSPENRARCGILARSPSPADAKLSDGRKLLQMLHNEKKLAGSTAGAGGSWLIAELEFEQGITVLRGAVADTTTGAHNTSKLEQELQAHEWGKALARVGHAHQFFASVREAVAGKSSPSSSSVTAVPASLGNAITWERETRPARADAFVMSLAAAAAECALGAADQQLRRAVEKENAILLGGGPSAQEWRSASLAAETGALAQLEGAREHVRFLDDRGGRGLVVEWHRWAARIVHLHLLRFAARKRATVVAVMKTLADLELAEARRLLAADCSEETQSDDESPGTVSALNAALGRLAPIIASHDDTANSVFEFKRIVDAARDMMADGLTKVDAGLEAIEWSEGPRKVSRGDTSALLAPLPDAATRERANTARATIASVIERGADERANEGLQAIVAIQSAWADDEAKLQQQPPTELPLYSVLDRSGLSALMKAALEEIDAASELGDRLRAEQATTEALLAKLRPKLRELTAFQISAHHFFVSEPAPRAAHDFLCAAHAYTVLIAGKGEPRPVCRGAGRV